MTVRINSLGLLGMEAFKIDVETDISKGMPAFDIVGLPDTSVREARERVRSAICNSGLFFPVKRIIVNLAPANIKKSGSFYDLPILVSLLLSSGILSADVSDCAFIGELSLSGEMHPINGLLPMAIKAKELGIRRFFVPFGNASEGAVIKGIEIYPVKCVAELIEHLTGKNLIQPAVPTPNYELPKPYDIDFADVCGQSFVKRALEIAAAGGHNVLMIGSPGSGKSMLAKRMPTILPDMTFDEMIETTKIHSVAGVMPGDVSLITHRPFRSPHHTVSAGGLSGGGNIPRPGEISLAHNGVLFLDELPEFGRTAMEVLRQPLEDGTVTISRVGATLSYPCSVTLIAAMNPCPCGYYGHPSHSCSCSPQSVSKYLSKVSGPLLDRLDLHVEVAPVDFSDLSSNQKEESSEQIKKRVNEARSIQNKRFEGTSISCNARMTPELLRRFCVLDDITSKVLERAFNTFGMSARAYDRILKVSRTVADLDKSEKIETRHILEALQYRGLDNKYWGKTRKKL